jgi:isopentenyl-diphosphate delta-isomerase
MRRLYEEMGISCELNEVFSFVYKARFDNGLTEYEFDHVFKGVTDKAPVPDVEEVQAWKYVGIDELLMDIENDAARYSEWFKICMRDWGSKLQGK